MCNVAHAYLVEGLDEEKRDQFRVKLYAEPGLVEVVKRLNVAKGG